MHMHENLKWLCHMKVNWKTFRTWVNVYCYSGERKEKGLSDQLEKLEKEEEQMQQQMVEFENILFWYNWQTEKTGNQCEI